MSSNRHIAPTPDLRIVLAEALRLHEEHDSQRALPLIQRLKTEEFVINPPIAAPMGGGQFVILDGANRCFALRELAYPHILVQVAAYDSGYVELQTWNHIVSGWDETQLLYALAALPGLEIVSGQHTQAIAHIQMRSQQTLAALVPMGNAQQRNAALCSLVRVYQQNATLYRTALNESEEIWPLYEEAIALIFFPRFQPADIMMAAKYNAYLPPGISRHIVHGRALRVNYPLVRLKDLDTRLSEKNEVLKRWLQDKLTQRQVRYYAESTYQFDE